MYPGITMSRPIGASDSGPDRFHRMNRNEISVVIAARMPSSKVMVNSPSSRMSSAMRWSALSTVRCSSMR
jgi:hypothetical protein